MRSSPHGKAQSDAFPGNSVTAAFTRNNLLKLLREQQPYRKRTGGLIGR
jgi:hypothetical protein